MDSRVLPRNKLDSSNYGIFWDEYRSIEQSNPQSQPSDVEDGSFKKEDKDESEIQWLNDVGFSNIAKKFRASTEIDHNDDDMKLIAASLTRAQANAVRRRIDFLNEAIRQRNQQERRPPLTQNKKKDVRHMFTSTHTNKLSTPTYGNKTVNYVGQRYVGISPNNASKTPVNGYDRTLKDAANTSLSNKTPVQASERVAVSPLPPPPPVAPKPKELQNYKTEARDRCNSDQITSSKLSQQSLEALNNFRERINKSSTFRHVQNQTPQIDNLVRRTSASHLILMSGEEREKSLKKNRPHNEIIEPKEQICIENDKKQDETNQETSSNIHVHHVKGSPIIDRGHSDIVTTLSEKKLVIVDSKYINVSSVEDSYKYKTKNYEKTHEKLTHSNSTYINNNEIVNNTRQVRMPVTVHKQHDLTLPTVPNVQKNILHIRKSDTVKTTDSSYNEMNKSTLHKSKSEKLKSNKTTSHNETEHENVINKPPVTTETINESSYNGIDKSSHRTPTNTRSIKQVNISSLSSYGSTGSIYSMSSSAEKPTFERTKSIDSYLDRNNISNRDNVSKCLSASSEQSSPRVSSPELGLEGDAKLDVGATTLKEPEQPGPTFPALPNFTLSKEELGMTHIGDLSEGDMLKVRSLALIELTALFDTYSIAMNRQKTPAKQKSKDNGVYGVSLITLSQREAKKDDDLKAPRIFQEMLTYLERNGLNEEGILRIPGSTPRVKMFREEIDKNDIDSLKWDCLKVTDIATCLKQFLRDLSTPLLSYEYQNTFTSVANLPDRKVQLQALNLLVLLLDHVHQETLKLLLIFLNKIIANEAKNKMGLNNVAMIMAPNLFFQNSTKINIDEAQKAAGMTDVLRMLIKYQSILWTIPAFMVGQIRYLIEAGAKTKHPKAVRKIIAKRLRIEGPVLGHRSKSSGSSGDELEENFEQFIIRVKAPNLNKQSMAIQLTNLTTAAEVIAKFQWRRQNTQKEKDEIDTGRLKINRSSMKEKKTKEKQFLQFDLCEAGGNIGERRLDQTANIAAIVRVNPNAEWLLKTRLKT